MNENQKLTKHVGAQKPLNQSPKPVDNQNNATSKNPIKPQETQKGLTSKK